MANRYFVGAVDSDWSDTGNWSNASGGSGGYSIPTASDAVIFDANSPSCALTANGDCYSIDTTGFAGVTGDTINLSGFNLTVAYWGVFVGADGNLKLLLGSGTLTLHDSVSGATHSVFASDVTLTASTSTLYLKKTCTLDSTTAINFYDLKLADSGETVTINTSIQYTHETTINGGTATGTNLTFVGTGAVGTVIHIETSSNVTFTYLRFNNGAAASGNVTGDWGGVTSAVYVAGNDMWITQATDVTAGTLYLTGSTATKAKWITDGYDLTTTSSSTTENIFVRTKSLLDATAGTGGTSIITLQKTLAIAFDGSVIQDTSVWNVTETFSMTVNSTWTGGSGTMYIGGDVSIADGLSNCTLARSTAIWNVTGNFTCNDKSIVTGTGNIIIGGNLTINSGAAVTQGACVWQIIGNIAIAASTWTYSASGSVRAIATVSSTIDVDTDSIGNLEVRCPSGGRTDISGHNLICETFDLYEGTFGANTSSYSFTINKTATIQSLYGAAVFEASGSSSSNSIIFNNDGSPYTTSFLSGTFSLSSTPTMVMAGASFNVSLGFVISGAGGESWNNLSNCALSFYGQSIGDLNFGDVIVSPVSGVSGTGVVVLGTTTIVADSEITFDSGFLLETAYIDWNSEGDPITLRANGLDHWLLKCHDASNSVTGVDVQLCDAFNGGQTINATDISNTDSGSNLNWDFGAGPSSSSSSFSSSSSSSFSSSSSSFSSSSSSFSSSSSSSSFSSSSSSSASDNGERYYVSDGATATWDNPLNWAYTSGGTGGAGVPGASSKVYFDLNSTRSCPLNSDAVCESFSMVGYNHTLELNGHTLEVETGTTIITSGTIKMNGGVFKLHNNATLIPTAVTSYTGKWLIAPTANVLIKVKNTLNLGIVELSGSGKQVEFDKYSVLGGLLCNKLTSNANILTTVQASLDSYEWHLTSCSLSANNSVYFRGNVTFSSVTVGAGGTYYIATNASLDFDGADLPNIQTTSGTARTVNFLSAFSTSGVCLLRRDDNITFKSGAIYNFNVITWNGTSGHLLVIRSSAGSVPFLLDVDDPTPTVHYVDVADSDASLGSTIIATDGSSVDYGNTINWLWPSCSSSSGSSSSSSKSSCSSSCSRSSCSSSRSSSSESSSLSSSSSVSSSSGSSSSYSSPSSSSSSESLSSSSMSSSSESLSSSSSSHSSSSFSSCSSSSSSMSGSSFTALVHTSAVAAPETVIAYIPESQLHNMLYNPKNTAPRFIFNRGFLLDDDDFGMVNDLTRRVVSDTYLGLMKYPGIVNRKDN